MKKLILVLAIVLIATQAFGALSVTLSKRICQNIVDVNYSGADPCNLPRAFALDVNISSTGYLAKFTAIDEYKIGESNAVVSGKPWSGLGYGIFPAKMTFDVNGHVSSWGDPLAAQGDIGAKDQILPSGDVVLELASLYKEPNAPPTSGRLCSLTVTPNGAASITISAVEEDTYRGGIVLEDGTAVNLTITPLVTTFFLPPGKATNPTPANGATGVNVTQDLSWTTGSGATSYDVYFGTANPPPQVSNDQTGTTYDTGTMALNTKYYWRINEEGACSTTTGDLWVFDTNCLYVGKIFAVACGTGPAVNISVTQAMVNRWNLPNVNRAKCWCCDAQKCGNGICTGGSTNRVDATDLAALKLSWNKYYTQPVYQPCLDFNLSGRIDAADLVILKLHWNKVVGSSGCL